MRHLQVIHAVISHGGVVAAADVLSVTQPAISRMLQAAEAELGLTLFEKVGRRLVPTEEAEQLFQEIDPFITSFRSVQERVVDIREGRLGILRIAATPGLAHSVVPLTLEKVLRKRPGMKTSLDIRRRENVLQMVRANVAELGLGLLPTDAPDIVSTPIGSGRIICVCPADHPLAANTVVRPSDFSRHRLIMMTRGSPLHSLIASAFDDARLPLNWAVETPYSASACNLVKAGFGVALVDSYATQQIEMGGLAVVPFEPNLTVTALLYRARHRPMSKLAKMFFTTVTEQN
ncbi:LysR family transcriptional regulator [Roseovarius sp. MMSF_3281]|uniref:LysR family transcriptional regulator n=1 Tax=Roseovarius sp. MMSF_3281 TaxID=3046694 RepID=UPI00273F2DBD|nr:LysR family transcriptional regulator [Roseovarius sp. MMSF_3281]